MKKNGSTQAKARVLKNTTRKMLIIPFCAYWVQISTTRLLSCDRGLLHALELDVPLDELHRAVGAGGHRLHGGAA